MVPGIWRCESGADSACVLGVKAGTGMEADSWTDCRRRNFGPRNKKKKNHITKGKIRAGAMAQRLRALTALLKALSSTPSMHSGSQLPDVVS